MLRVAICDDDPNALANSTSLLEAYQKEKDIVIKLDTFNNAIELLDSLRTHGYDLLLLDVLMPGLTGMEAAREIRTYDSHLPLIFLTSSPDFAVESYSVDALSYLLKPVSQDSLFPVLDRLLRKLLRAEEALILKLSSGIIRLPFSKIEYLEVNNKHLRFRMEDGSIKEIPGTLSEYEPRLLSRNEFIKVHRSYIVNLSHVQSLDSKDLVTYSGGQVPIARASALQVRQKYADYLFEEDF